MKILEDKNEQIFLENEALKMKIFELEKINQELKSQCQGRVSVR